MGKISVVVPIYNVEKYLPKCIESILNQTYKNLEIILVDDGSTDNSGKIIDEYAKKDSRILAIHKQNGGCSSARNYGLDIATGTYIAFADSDDIIHEREYEVLYNLIKKYDVDIAFCELQTISSEQFEQYPNIEVNVRKKEELFEKILTPAEALNLIILNPDVGNYVPLKMFKKELFEGHRFEDKVYYEDVALLYKVVSGAERIAYTNEKLYYYQINRVGATTASFNEKKIIDSMNAYYAQHKFILQNYPQTIDASNFNFVKMYTSAMEKVCMNEDWNLYNSEMVTERYEEFKKSYSNLSKEYLIKNLEPYRLISATILDEDRSLYKETFNTLFSNLKNK